jgi:hypothetical protein
LSKSRNLDGRNQQHAINFRSDIAGHTIARFLCSPEDALGRKTHIRPDGIYVDGAGLAGYADIGFDDLSCLGLGALLI